MKRELGNFLRAIGVAVAVLAAATGARAGEIVQTGDASFQQGQAALTDRLAIRPIDHRARNIIVFIADGSGVASNTAIRIADGQQRGGTGEENVLAYEAFPHLALAKTYTADAQLPDSAGTATAILSGVKTRNSVLGVGQEAVAGDCASALAHPVATLGEFPFEVAMGGGRQHFLPLGLSDIERGTGLRADGRDLIAEWRAAGPGRAVVQIRPEFDRLAGSLPDRVLGLFSPSYMAFEADRPDDWGGEPSLAEMIRMAIEILGRDPDGFVLLVEAGRIDHAFHATDLHRSVTDGIALNDAVRVAAALTDAADTLIIVTSDHTDPMPPWGHGPRGAPVLDFDGWHASDHPPPPDRAGPRGLGPIVFDFTGATAIAVSTTAGTPSQAGSQAGPPVGPPAGPGSHGPADVAVYARGPMAYLIGGTVEQHYIFHVIGHALGLDAPD